MANRLKTVQYAFPVLASLSNNTLTNLTQITVYLPESGAKTIRKAWLEVSMDDIVDSTAGTLNVSTIDMRLGAAAYTSTTGHIRGNTSENIAFQFTRDFTSHFAANWSGTSMTCDARLTISTFSGSPQGMANVCAVLYITYEYDDTSTTQLKSVAIPLDAPAATLPTSKTSHDTVPALDTYLPEASKTYRNIFIVTQANRNHSTATDHTVTYELSSLGAHVTATYKSALLSDVWTRYVWDITSYITTNTTHTFNAHSSVTGRHHSMQAWMVVTYEYDESTSTNIMNSIQLPMEIDSPMGGPLSADFQRSTREFWVQETNPTRQRLAFYMFWQAASNETGLNARIGTGSFVPYTNTGSGFVCGNKGLMIRNDSPTGVPFARGRNTLQMDVYNESTTQRGGNVGGFWLLNYTSDKHPDGSGAHNHSVLWPVYTQDAGFAFQQYITTADSPNIPEANYFVTALGFHFNFMQNATQQGMGIKVERLASGEGGLVFERLYSDPSQHDTEMGAYDVYAQARTLFNRWAGDPDSTRLDLETNRRYLVYSGNAVTFPNHLNIMLTYHTITYTADDSITGFSGTVTLDLHRSANGEKVLSTTRSGDGAFSFTWYDDTEELYVVADDGTNVGRSEDTLAS